ncbi:MAG: hypothetical protein IT424_00530 [Pirellulales bacterium]|nr:hypothetical protein [Pirellulales bacterium]
MSLLQEFALLTTPPAIRTLRTNVACSRTDAYELLNCPWHPHSQEKTPTVQRMAADATTIDRMFETSLRVWDKVRPVNKTAKEIRNQIAKYFDGQQIGLLKHADPKLKTCMQAARSFLEYTRTFTAPGVGRVRDATYFLTEYTTASVGRTADNRKAVEKLSELKRFLENIAELAASLKAATNAIFALVTPQAGLKSLAQTLTSVTTAANIAARDHVIRDCDASIGMAAKIISSVQLAIDQVHAIP